jgi:putative ATP-dependent endonuclease of OLD family
MKLTRLKIENFRSIQYLDLPIRDLNAFIGANSCGKSNILTALNLVIGSTYASIRSFSESDFFQRDPSNYILIEVIFSEHLASNANVWGFSLLNNGTQVSYTAIDQHGNACTYANGSEIKVSSQMKDEVTFLYLTLDRLAYQQIKPTQWTIYGKLLRKISGVITTAQKDTFLKDIENTYTTNVKPHVDPIEAQLRNYVRDQTGLDLVLNLSLFDPTWLLKDLRPRISDNTGFQVDIDEEGAGVQSSVAIAIARVYSEVIGGPLIIAIEEPELYLHPHACRHFYKILKQLSENNVQVLYTTHERSFVNVRNYTEINLIKKENGETEAKYHTGVIPDFDEIKIASKFDEEINEVFFASKVILVEGPDDKIAVREAFERLGVELDKHNISVIDCGGITGIKPLAEILSYFQIQTLALVDEDPGNVATASRIAALGAIAHPPQIFLQTPNLEGLFTNPAKFTKNTALRLIPQFYDSPNPVQQVYIDLKSALNLP